MSRRRNPNRRVTGPYKHGARWRVVVVTPGSEENLVEYFYYPTEAEAIEVIKESRRELAGDLAVTETIAAWRKHLESTKVKEITVETSVYRLGLFFAGQETSTITAFTTRQIEKLYEKLREKVAVQTHRHALAETKRFMRWCVKRGWLRSSPAARVDPVGRPRKGKPQLRVTESRQLVDTAVAAACDGDESAMAVLIALVLGRRASEVTNLEVRDVDDGASLVWVADAKTEAGRVFVEVPVVLRPLLLALAEARKAEGAARLFPGRTRYWVYYHSLRLCRLAGVPEVCPHGLRGTHGTLADQAGATAEMVTRAMGWTSITVGDRHYFAPGSRARSRAARAATRLLPAGQDRK